MKKFRSMLNFSPPQHKEHKSGCYCYFTQRTCADAHSCETNMEHHCDAFLAAFLQTRKMGDAHFWSDVFLLAVAHSLIFMAGIEAWKWKRKKNHFMNPIMDFLTLVSFYCISLFMIPHSELIPNAMTITAGPHCRRRRQEKESSIKTFFAMKRNVL